MENEFFVADYERICNRVFDNLKKVSKYIREEDYLRAGEKIQECYSLIESHRQGIEAFDMLPTQEHEKSLDLLTKNIDVFNAKLG